MAVGFVMGGLIAALMIYYYIQFSRTKQPPPPTTTVSTVSTKKWRQNKTGQYGPDYGNGSAPALKKSKKKGRPVMVDTDLRLRGVELKTTVPSRSQSSYPQRTDPQLTHPQPTEPQRAHPQPTEPQRANPQRTDTQRAHPQRTKPQRAHPQRKHSQSKGQRSKGPKSNKHVRVKHDSSELYERTTRRAYSDYTPLDVPQRRLELEYSDYSSQRPWLTKRYSLPLQNSRLNWKSSSTNGVDRRKKMGSRFEYYQGSEENLERRIPVTRRRGLGNYESMDMETLSWKSWSTRHPTLTTMAYLGY